MTLELVFTASLSDVPYYRDSVESKQASLLVVPLGKTFAGISMSRTVDTRYMAGNAQASSL